ncbi:hypothetical protein BN2476_560084 [Paraburkholderia piptadeniae]|uniref:Uncharacterized protein n=1 Tax=Paraburkholderia piptadeniae TaxID=1701573 RepID=A0A1N7SIY6_9BURK|nr:hypothetical protein BN2476_560084 [Paraburkholderia piptadeniae]
MNPMAGDCIRAQNLVHTMDIVSDTGPGHAEQRACARDGNAPSYRPAGARFVGHRVARKALRAIQARRADRGDVGTRS